MREGGGNTRPDDLLGAHVSTQGGVANAPARGATIGATAIQIFTKTPSQWREPAIAPAHVEVQHILIGFAGSVPGKGITRTKEEAMRLAHEILDKARKGANFDSLVAKYTDDSPPGIYKMAGDGVPPQVGEYGRRQMVPAFGNVGFAISPGNIDIAEYDPTTSPFGWHIIKRLR